MKLITGARVASLCVFGIRKERELQINKVRRGAKEIRLMGVNRDII